MNLIKNNIKWLLFEGALMFSLPLVTFAAPATFKEFVVSLIGIVTAIIPVLIGAAFLVFIWGIANFILNSGDGKEQTGAKNTMFWGVIALFVMVSVWGIIRMLQNTFIP